MNDELKYCKFCDKTKPKKEFCKSGFAIKNICRECQNKKQKEKLKTSKNWNELKKWLEEDLKDGRSEENVWLMGCYDQVKEVLDKMQELGWNNE